MKNGIYSIYMGSSENIDKIENTTCFSLIEKESKRQTKDGKNPVIRFLYNELNGQRIKVPPRFQITNMEEVSDVVEYDNEYFTSIRKLKFDFKANTKGNNRKGKSDISVLLNFNTLSPFLSLSNKDASYLYLTIDTNSLSLIQYSKSNIIATFKNPKANILGCLIELTDEVPLTFYTRDNSKRGFFKVHCFSLDEGELVYTVSSDLVPEELRSMRALWNRKKKTRTFLYNFNVMPATHLTHTETEERPNSIVCKAREDCESDDEFVKEVEESLRAAIGYVPKAVVLDKDFIDMTYEDMIKLRFTYVFGTRENEDGSTYTVTLKSN